MAEKRVSIRLGIIGGQEVTAEFDQIGKKGSDSLGRIGDTAERASSKVAAAGGRFKSTFQNVGYQVQDMAVQIGGGTSAFVALGQQLPQLLGGFGLLGVAIGAVVAIGIPLARYLLNMKDTAKAAADAVKVLAGDVTELKQANDAFTFDGIDKLIERYGVLDGKIVMLTQRQRQFAMDKAMIDARKGVTDLAGSLSGVENLVNRIRDIKLAEGMRGAALSASDLADVAAELQDKFGLTVDQATAIKGALDAARSANSLGEMADATAVLNDNLADSKLKGTELAGTLIDGESNLRALNAEGARAGGWIAAATAGAAGLAAKLWDAATGAAAIRGAQARAQNMSIGDDGRVIYRDQLYANMAGRGVVPEKEYGIPGDHAKPPHVGGGGGQTDAQKDRNKMETEAKAIFDSTRTSAEKYKVEIARLDQIKAAGLITGDTYNRQVDDLGLKYGQQLDLLSSIRMKMRDYAEEAGKSGAAIGDAIAKGFDSAAGAVGDFVRDGKVDFHSLVGSILGDLATLAAKSYVLGPIAAALGLGGAAGGAAPAGGGGGFFSKIIGALAGSFGGGAGGGTGMVVHEGGMAGSGMAREISAAMAAGARRYHSGGLAGDEVMSILQKGERVLNRRQTREYDRGGPGRGMVVNFNVKDGQSLRQSRTQIASDAGRALAMGTRAR